MLKALLLQMVSGISRALDISALALDPVIGSLARATLQSTGAMI